MGPLSDALQSALVALYEGEEPASEEVEAQEESAAVILSICEVPDLEFEDDGSCLFLSADQSLASWRDDGTLEELRSAGISYQVVDGEEQEAWSSEDEEGVTRTVSFTSLALGDPPLELVRALEGHISPPAGAPEIWRSLFSIIDDLSGGMYLTTHRDQHVIIWLATRSELEWHYGAVGPALRRAGISYHATFPSEDPRETLSADWRRGEASETVRRTDQTGHLIVTESDLDRLLNEIGDTHLQPALDRRFSRPSPLPVARFLAAHERVETSEAEALLMAEVA